METKAMSSTMKGLIISLILIVIGVATYLLAPELQQNRTVQLISSLLIVAGIVWATMQYGKDMNGNVTFGNLFAHGFKTTAVVTVIMVVYTLLALTVIFPEMKDKAIEAAQTQMEKEGKLSEAQIDQALAMTRKLFMPFAIGGVVVVYLLFGALGSLIGAAIGKKNPNPQPFQ